MNWQRKLVLIFWYDEYDKTVTIELVTKYLNEPSIYAKLAIDNLKEDIQ